MTDLPLIMVVEDDQHVQSVVDDALADGGFEPAIMASGEETVTLLQANSASTGRLWSISICVEKSTDGKSRGERG